MSVSPPSDPTGPLGQPPSQPPYGQPAGPPQYGPPPGPPAYGPPAGGPQYGPPPGQPSYGPPPGQPSYGPPPGQPSYGPPAGQPPYGAPAGQPFGPAGYPPMPPPPQGSFGNQTPLKRPSQVTTAAVIAFIIGGLSLIALASVFSLTGISGLGFLRIIVIVSAIVAGALIWGGVQALSGKDGRVLAASAAGALLLNVVSLIIYFQTRSLLSFILPSLIIYLLLTKQAKSWFDAKGAKHF